VDDVLHAMDDDRALRILGQGHEALDAQELRAVRRAQKIEEHVEGGAPDGLVARHAEGADALVMAVHVVMVVVIGIARVGVRMAALFGLIHRLGAEPGPDVGDLAVGIEEAGADEFRGWDIASPGLDDGGARIEGGQALAQNRHAGSIRKIGLGHDDAVGDGRLAHGFRVAVERRQAVHRIDYRDDPLERVAHGEIRVIQHRVQDWGRVREPRGLDDHAPERGDAAVVAPAQQVLKGGDEIAAHRATQAAGRQQDHAVIDGLDEKMIEADLAELVDDDDGVGKGRIAQKTVQEGRLAGAKEPREDGERDRRQRTAPAVRHVCP
jgi:hypothetical protein